MPAIVRMVNHTRLDCLLGGATGIRRGTVEAIHHARHRAAFGVLLVDQPAMRNVLADLAIESEAATAAALRVARSYDDPDDGAFRRFATAVMKYWVCKRAAPHAAEALECLGGNGFVEESGLPLLYRDAPLNSIWEGSGNVAALDVLRAMVKEPDGLPAFVAECELAGGADARLDAHLERVRVAARDGVRFGRGGRGSISRAADRRGPRRRAPGVAARPDRAARRRRRVLRRPSRRRRRPRVRDAPGGCRGRRDHRPGAAGVSVLAGAPTKERLLACAQD